MNPRVTTVKTRSIKKSNLWQSVKSVYYFTELFTQQFEWKWSYTDFTDQHRSAFPTLKSSFFSVSPW